MEDIYTAIWDLARPYYEKGRPKDVVHIEWMMPAAREVCEKEGVDPILLLPLVILHDVGYADVEPGNPYNLDMRRAHMAAGAKIAKKVLAQVGYPADKAEKIEYYVSVHDNWALGDNAIYAKDKVLGVFQDLDFMWMATPLGFHAVRAYLGKNDREMLAYIQQDTKLTDRPFCTPTTESMFKRYMQERNVDAA